MKHRLRDRLILPGLLLGNLALLAGSAPALATPEADPRLVQGRAVVQQFAGELRGALEKAMGRAGPPGAIAVCRDEAPAIAARLSQESGARVSRTSTRVRNPANAAQPWQREVLAAFERRLADKAPPESLEHFEVRPDGSARLMKAIVTQSMCLTCHGATIIPAVRGAIERDYPQDEATGFTLGSLRGAFVVDWPAVERKRMPGTPH
jgi:hypothetical protein